jgi:hypothetical protein
LARIFAVSEIVRFGTVLSVAYVLIDVPKGMHMQSTETELETEATQSLNAADRCDECGAQAYIRVELATGELLFCGHHGNEKREALQPIALKWTDETEKLLSR